MGNAEPLSTWTDTGFDASSWATGKGGIGYGDTVGDELTGGYIFRVDRDDPNVDDGWYSAYRSRVFFGYYYPKASVINQAQKNYLKNYITEFENAMNSPASSGLYQDYIDVESFVDYWIATEVFKHIDGFKLSFYMYKKKDSEGGKIHFGPLWDHNLAFGNYNFGRDPGPQDGHILGLMIALFVPFGFLNYSVFLILRMK